MKKPIQRAEPFRIARSRPAGVPGRPVTGLLSIAGATFSLAAVAAATALALVFAATLALVLIVAAALLSLTAFAWRVRRRPVPAGVTLNARKVGHAWVTYGWDDAKP